MLNKGGIILPRAGDSHVHKGIPLVPPKRCMHFSLLVLAISEIYISYLIQSNTVISDAENFASGRYFSA